MRPLRALLALPLVVAGLAVAGCGAGGSGTSGSGSAPGTASLAPVDAGIWASIDTDVGSAQWTALDAVLGQIPGAEAAIDSALGQIGSNTGRKLDLRKDVLPALGKEVIVILPAGAANPVLLAKPPDEAALEKVLDGSTPPVKTTRDGWTVFGKTQKALDTYTAAADKGSLADSDAFKTAMDGLPADALVRAYVDGKGLTGIASTAAGSASGALKNIPIPGVNSLPTTKSGIDPKALDRLGTIGVALSAGKNEIRIDGSAGGSSAQIASYTPKLLNHVPADALAAISLAGNGATASQIRESLASAGIGDPSAETQKLLGVSFDDLVALADGEGVAYLRPSLIIPEVTVVLTPKDPAQALKTLDTVAAKLTASAGGKTTTTTVDGIPFTVVHVSILGIAIGRDGDEIVITTVPTSFPAFKGNGPKLVDNDDFKNAVAGIGMGDTMSGLAYVNVKGLAPLLNTIASAAGSGSGSSASVQKVIAALSAIDSAALYSKIAGGRVVFHGAVRVG